MINSRTSLLLALSALAMPSERILVQPDFGMPHRSTGKVNGSALYRGNRCTDWKRRHQGKTCGVDYGKRECERRMRQMARSRSRG